MADSPRIEELKRRVQVDPASIAFAALAEEYRRAGRYEEAIATCQAGLQRHPAYLSARVTLGRALLQLGQYVEAREELEHVLRAAPENLAAIRGLAEIHHRRGELPEALEQYRSALHVAKHDAEIADAVDQISKQVAPALVDPIPVAQHAAPEPEPERRPEPPARPHLELVKRRGVEGGSERGSEEGSEEGSEKGSETGSEWRSEGGAELSVSPSELFSERLPERISEPSSERLSEPVSEPPSEPLAEPFVLANPSLPALESFLSAILREKAALHGRPGIRF